MSRVGMGWNMIVASFVILYEFNGIHLNQVEKDRSMRPFNGKGMN